MERHFSSICEHLWTDTLISAFPRLRDCAEELNEDLSVFDWEISYSGFDFDLDIRHSCYLQAGFLATFDSKLRYMSQLQASLRDWSQSGETRTGFLNFWFLNELKACPPEEPSRPSYAVAVSAVVLLSFIYQYLTGDVDRSGSKAYSRSSLDSRDTYVAIVLFLGAYVWIKFREVAFKGVHPRKLVDKAGRITKVVYEPRFKPPREKGRVFQWLYLGQYATPEEASILYRIAAFYYNKNHVGLLDLEDGRWFSIPPMSEGEQNLTGAEKRAWVKVQAPKVYEEFKKEKAAAAAAAAFLQELLEPWEDQVTPEQDEVHVDLSESRLLNSAAHQQAAIVSPVENPDIAMLDDQGFECASQTFGGMQEGLAVPNGHILGSHEGPAIPVSHLTPNTHSGMGINSSNQLDLLQIVNNQLELISYQQQQISLQRQQLQDCRAQISELKNQHCLQQQLQDINEGVPSNGVEMEMEQSMHLQNHLSFMTLPYAGAEAQEAFI